MVIDLLELSRIDAGATDLHTEEVDLAELCGRVAAPLRLRRPADRGPPPRHSVDGASSTGCASSASSATCWRTPTTHGGGPTADLDRAGGRHDSCSIAVEDAGPGVARERAGADLRALRPRQRGPPPDRHRARPGARRRARHAPRAARRGSRTARAAAPASSSGSRRRSTDEESRSPPARALVLLLAACGLGDSELRGVSTTTTGWSAIADHDDDDHDHDDDHDRAGRPLDRAAVPRRRPRRRHRSRRSRSSSTGSSSRPGRCW